MPTILFTVGHLAESWHPRVEIRKWMIRQRFYKRFQNREQRNYLWKICWSPASIPTRRDLAQDCGGFTKEHESHGGRILWIFCPGAMDVITFFHNAILYTKVQTLSDSLFCFSTLVPSISRPNRVTPSTRTFPRNVEMLQRMHYIQRLGFDRLNGQK